MMHCWLSHALPQGYQSSPEEGVGWMTACTAGMMHAGTSERTPYMVDTIIVNEGTAAARLC